MTILSINCEKTLWGDTGELPKESYQRRTIKIGENVTNFVGHLFNIDVIIIFSKHIAAISSKTIHTLRELIYTGDRSE